MALVQTVIVGAGVMVAWLVDGPADVAAYGARILFVVLAYTLPFVALMSLSGALIGSAAASILGAVAFYAVVAIAGGLLSPQWEIAGYVGYLFPSPLKPALLTLFAMLLYTAAYYLLGWFVFRRRDI
jgi:ABC-type transport system involved in multi-copper enzyme maturation permease subunit